jgi:pimeloyl-ACP methyl ester carboxylesterase
MNLIAALAALLIALLVVLAGITRVGAWLIERRNPPVGTFAEIDGARLHYVHVPAAGAELPPVVFIHGASGNLLDQMLPIRPLLEGRAEMLFVDRPGHGWSTRGTHNDTPSGQAATIAALMDRLGIERAVIVGHSFGAGVAATFALDHPGRTAGLVFVAGATHPWPGGETAWYYRLVARPVLGRLFVQTLALPAGLLRIDAASAGVFEPNGMPDAYLRDAAVELVLRPKAFRSNAIDVAGLYDHVVQASPRYGGIAAPTVVISGDSDTIVYEEIHSLGLARDIPGAELAWVRNLGHKPDWIAPDLVLAAIEKVSGLPADLEAAVRRVEARVAADRQRTPEAQKPSQASQIPPRPSEPI